MPNKEDARQILVDLLKSMRPIDEKYENLLNHLMFRDADVRWLVSMTYYFMPTHTIFSESFVAPTKSRKKEVNVEAAKERDKQFNVYKGAFKNIPERPMKNRRKRLTVSGTLLKEKKPSQMQLLSQ